MPNFEITKLLTQSNITKKVFLPTQILKHIPIPQGTHFVDLQVKNSMEQVWTLRLYTRPTGQYPTPVFTVGWLEFVRAKHLQVGDKLIFSGHQVRASEGELQMQYRIQVTRTIDLQGQPISAD
ncbi:hypothetical protein QYF36_001310 [Acer negundo]|nr:hypothetical protein QYF36_001310 [Acer negundo]